MLQVSSNVILQKREQHIILVGEPSPPPCIQLSQQRLLQRGAALLVVSHADVAKVL